MAADPARSVSLWLAGVMALAVLALQVVPVLAPAIAEAMGLPPAFVGAWSALVWAAALVGTLWAPVLLARQGAWALAQACLVSCAAGAALAALGHPAGLLLAALAIGLGHGLEGPTASHLLAAHVSAPRRALWFSIKQTGVQIGAVVGSFTLPVLALAWGWRAAALAVAGAALVFALLLQAPARAYAVPHAPSRADGAFGALAALRDQPVLRWMALAAACFGAIQIALNGFFVTYAVREREASLVQAGAWLGAAQIGGLVGRVGWGWLAGRIGRITPLVITLGFVMSACALWLGLAGPAWWLLVAFGLSASGWNGIFLAEVAQQVPPQQAGTATAAVMGVMTLGLVAGPLVFSALGAWASFATAFVVWAGVALAGSAALWRAQSLGLARQP